MRHSPLISIIIPLYNRVNLVQKTLGSVMAQTYQHWEAVVVDDGSDDGSFEMVQQLAEKDERIRLLRRNRLPKGAPVCRNIGAEQAKGEYIIFLDSDDELADFCLRQRIQTIQKYPNPDFWVFPILLFHKDKDDMNILWNIDTGEDDLIRFLRLDAVWQTSSPIYKKSYVVATQGFDEALPFWQDFEFHTRLLIRKPTYLKFYDAQPDMFCRRHSATSISQVPFISEEQLEKKLEVSMSLIDLLIQEKKESEYLEEIKVTVFGFIEELLTKYPETKVNYRKFWNKIKQKNMSTGFQYTFIDSYFAILKLSKKLAFFYPAKVLQRKSIPDNFKERKTTLCRVHLNGNSQHER